MPTQPRRTAPWITFTGEYVKAETGETENLYGISVNDAIRIIKAAKDGDAIVLNASA